jgi:hypothetical protein
MYSCVQDIVPDAIYEEPRKEQQKWSQKENQQWLQMRALDSTGNAATVHERVMHYMQLPRGLPNIVPPKGGLSINVSTMVYSLHAMLGRLMKKEMTNDDICNAKWHIKLFLSSFEIFDSAMREETEKPTWITSYNFICLTNLPCVMEEYGPLQNLWEGGGQGEKIISLLKPVWYGFRKNWHKNLLQNVLQQVAIKRVRHSEEEIHES